MACCTAILERCDPAGTPGENTVLAFADSETQTVKYLSFPSMAPWAGDPTTLVNCSAGSVSQMTVTENADGTTTVTHDPGNGTTPTTFTYGGGTDTTVINDDGAGNVTITNPDTGDTTTSSVSDNGDGTASVTIGGATCDLSAEDQELLCDTPDPGMVTLRTTDLKTGSVGDISFTAASRCSFEPSSGSLIVQSDTPVGETFTFATHEVTVPCDMDLLVNANMDIWHRNRPPGDLGVLQGAVFEMLVVLDGGTGTRISGILRFNNKASSEEGIIVGTGCVPVTKGAHTIDFQIRLFENTIPGVADPTGYQIQTTQGVSTVHWTELVCC